MLNTTVSTPVFTGLGLIDSSLKRPFNERHLFKRPLVRRSTTVNEYHSSGRFTQRNKINNTGINVLMHGAATKQTAEIRWSSAGSRDIRINDSRDVFSRRALCTATDNFMMTLNCQKIIVGYA
jgi:hypothetical protein